MKRSLFVYGACIAMLASSGQAAVGGACRDLFQKQSIREDWIGHEGRRTFAALLERAGVADSAYAVQWKLKENSNPGPYPTSGEFIASAVPREKVVDWLRTAGKNTIGFAVEGVPFGRGFHSATLRIGNRLYRYSDIQSDGSYVSLESAGYVSPHTEATFFVTDAEMKEINKFIEARGNDEIVAKEKVRNGPDIGETIEPDFNYYKNTLTQESCAGACSSFVNPLWLKHYDGARILQQMVDRLELESTPVAKAMVWKQARKPNLMAITQFGVTSNDAKWFIENNKWGQLKGMPVYSLIPDPRGGENNQVIAKRMPLREWLARD
ncbi:MAG: hypothetical protein JNJ49_14425 [Bdellovibrionaceae bacterium]|nr:hypothetical protein [Pseudobdellovibrionaceae bacterium]